MVCGVVLEVCVVCGVVCEVWLYGGMVCSERGVRYVWCVMYVVYERVCICMRGVYVLCDVCILEIIF